MQVTNNKFQIIAVILIFIRNIQDQSFSKAKLNILAIYNVVVELFKIACSVDLSMRNVL